MTQNAFGSPPPWFLRLATFVLLKVGLYSNRAVFRGGVGMFEFHENLSIQRWLIYVIILTITIWARAKTLDDI